MYSYHKEKIGFSQKWTMDKQCIERNKKRQNKMELELPSNQRIEENTVLLTQEDIV